MDNPERILTGIEISSSKSGIPSHLRALSSKIVRSPEDRKFDDKIQEFLLRSKSENELTEIILDPQRLGIDTSSLISKKE